LLFSVFVPFQPFAASPVGAASPGKVRWAYYVPYDPTSLVSLRQALPNLDYVSPFWFYIDAQGQIPDKDQPDVTRLIKSSGARILPTFRNEASYGDFHGVLADSGLRQRAISNILRLVAAHGYDGVNIDFEALDPSDRSSLNGFMADLASALRSKGKLVTQAVPARDKDRDTGWAGAFDYAGLAPSNDFILLMSYSYRTASSTVAGSTAPMDWVEATVAYAASQIPAHKLLLGVAWYGYDWNITSGPPAKAMLHSQTMEVAARLGVSPEYDEASQTAVLNYNQNGQDHQVWYEDQRSVNAKMKLVNKYGLAGVGGWRLGQEDPAVWDVWKASLSYRTWYLAEGCTCKPFDTWVLIMNPNEAAANVTVTFMKEDGSTVVQNHKVAAQSRFNLFANQVVPDAAVSTRVDSDLPVFVERAMYFGHDGHNTPGVNGPSQTWYLAEGYSGAGTDTWVLIMNPNPLPASATVTFMKEDGSQVERKYSLGPTSRLSIYANEIVPNVSFSTRVVADQPVVVERAGYFGQGGGHGGIASAYSARTWYLPEGFTGHNTSVAIMNPNPQTAKVTVTFMTDNGQNVNRSYTLKPTSRTTINAHDFLPRDTAFGTRVTSDQPVVVERSSYWDNGRSGHSSLAASSPAVTWYLAEGSTAPPFTEFVSVMNTNDSPANLSFSFMLEGGGTVNGTYSVGARSRFTLNVNGAVPNKALSVRVNSDVPVVVERMMYSGTGGHSSIGIGQ